MKFRELALYLTKLEKTSSRNEITQILSELFKKASSQEIDKIVYLVLGTLAPNYQGIDFNVAERLMLQIIARAYGVDIEKVRKAFKEKGDLGIVAEAFAKGKGQDPEVLSVYQKMLEVAKEGGGGSQERKIAKAAELLSSLDPLSARYVARIPVANLRLGFSDMTILDALSLMVKGDKSARPQIEAAFNVSVDIGKIAKSVKEKGLAGLKLVKPEAGIPIRPSLAERLPSAEKILEKVGEKVIVEPKYDGFRCVGGYTPVYVKDKGYLSVKDIKVGDMVLTHKGRFKKVASINKRIIDKGERLFKFQTYLGDAFKISEGHKILVFRNGKERWVPVENVSVGEETAFPIPVFQGSKPNDLPNPHLDLVDEAGYKKIVPTDSNFYRILGFWIGDGFTNEYHNTERIGLTFNAKSERKLAREYKKIVSATLGITKVSEFEHNGGISIYWRDRPFRQWLSRYFRCEWEGKRLPNWFLGINKEGFMAFLQGWIESDGTPRHSGGYKIVTKERDLAAFAQLLALSHGIVIGVKKSRVRLSNGFSETYYELIIPGTERIAKFKGRSVLVKVLRKEEIKRPDPRTNLYNLEVKDDKSYCTGMASLHNCQLHIYREGNEKKIAIFSRNLESTTAMFPDLVQAAEKIKVGSAIFDAEAIGFDAKTGRFLPFQETVQRKRKYDIEEMVKKLPLRLFVFDILYKDGKSYIETPFGERRKILEKTLSEVNDKIEITRQEIVDSAQVIRTLQKGYLAEGLEGALIKKIDAPYKAGARGYHWVKYKKTTEGGLTDTIDCLVMGINKGRGKRTGFGVGAFLVGVREGDKFKSVSKIGTGLTDEQWRELNKRMKKLEVKEKPKEYEVHKNLETDTWANPSLVVEILADEITRSPIHTAGLALRFPRLIRFRDEKSPSQATSTGELTKLYKMQKK